MYFCDTWGVFQLRHYSKRRSTTPRRVGVVTCLLTIPKAALSLSVCYVTSFQLQLWCMTMVMVAYFSRHFYDSRFQKAVSITEKGWSGHMHALLPQTCDVYTPLQRDFVSAASLVNV